MNRIIRESENIDKSISLRLARLLRIDNLENTFQIPPFLYLHVCIYLFW